MATSELIKRALDQATPAQLIKVRALIGENYGSYGYDSWAGRYKEALDAFDNAEYDNKQIAFLLEDEKLAEALQ